MKFMRSPGTCEPAGGVIKSVRPPGTCEPAGVVMKFMRSLGADAALADAALKVL